MFSDLLPADNAEIHLVNSSEILAYATIILRNARGTFGKRSRIRITRAAEGINVSDIIYETHTATLIGNRSSVCESS